MDWSKLDAALAAALADGEPSRRHLVFLHLAPDAAAGDLAGLGIDAAGDGAILTASLTRDQVERLSDQAWVRNLRLSRSVGLPAEP